MATSTGTLVSAILQIISDWRGEASTNSDSSRIRAVSRAERDFARRKFWRTHLLRDQTATADGVSTSYTIGNATYPMRMKGLTELFVDGTVESARYEVVDFGTFHERYNRSNADKMVYEYYDATLDLWKMRVNPTPESGKTLTYSYYWEPPERTTTADVVVCPDPEIIAHMALAQIYQGEDEDDKRDAELQTAESLIDEVVGWEQAPAVGQLQTFGAIENAGRNRGIGTY